VKPPRAAQQIISLHELFSSEYSAARKILIFYLAEQFPARPPEALAKVAKERKSLR